MEQYESFHPGYYTSPMLRRMGFKSIGDDVKIQGNCAIFGPENIEIGDNVRIDGFCTISAVGGFLKIGSNVHIAGYCLLIAGAGIVLGDFTALSHGTKVYSKSDDYSGEFLTNPTVPAEFTNVIEGTVTIGRHSIVGAGSVIMPGVTIGEISAVGAMSLVAKSIPPGEIWGGVPAKWLKNRSTKLLELEGLCVHVAAAE